MKLIEKILLAIDFMEGYEKVVDHAVQLAEAFHATIVPLHVLPSGGEEKLKKMVETAAQTKLSELQQHLSKLGIKSSEAILESGRPYNVIVDVADRMDVNVIAIGAGVKKKKDKYQLGTTAEKIIRWSDKPVWVVKKDQAPEVKTILCPVDFSEPSTISLKNAIIVARRFDAELIVLSVYEQISSRGAVYYKKEWEEQGSLGLSKHKGKLGGYLVKNFKWHGVKWKRIVRSGAPETEILSAIEDHEVDLLMMGTTGRSGLNKLMMGSVTEKVVREVPCSFVTTKAEDLIRLQLESSIKDIDRHYQIATQLVKDGFFEEAEQEYNICLKISNMHLPSLNGLVKLYELQGKEKDAATYRKMARDVLHTIWNSRIEEDIRRGLG